MCHTVRDNVCKILNSNKILGTTYGCGTNAYGALGIESKSGHVGYRVTNVYKIQETTYGALAVEPKSKIKKRRATKKKCKWKGFLV